MYFIEIDNGAVTNSASLTTEGQNISFLHTIDV